MLLNDSEFLNDESMIIKKRIQQIVKIIIGVVVFISLPTLLLFGILYLRYNEDLPNGNIGLEADKLAVKMLNSLDYEAYKNTSYLEWTFKNQHHYKWYKSADSCLVSWSNFSVMIQFKTPKTSKVLVAQKEYNGIEKQKYIDKAVALFNNDSFWLVAPYKIFDSGTERRLVKNENGNDALLVTYTSGGTTPGDSYLWHLDKSGKPKSFQMWVDILPIDGFEATWNNWTTTESGAILPTLHKLLFLDIELTNIKTK